MEHKYHVGDYVTAMEVPSRLTAGRELSYSTKNVLIVKARYFRAIGRVLEDRHKQPSNKPNHFDKNYTDRILRLNMSSVAKHSKQDIIILKSGSKIAFRSSNRYKMGHGIYASIEDARLPSYIPKDCTHWHWDDNIVPISIEQCIPEYMCEALDDDGQRYIVPIDETRIET